MAIDAYAALKDFIMKLLGQHDTAAQYAQDPEGTLAAQGITDHDLSGVDIRQVVGECTSGLPLSDSARSALQNYSSGGPAPSGYPSVPPPPQSAHPQPAEVVQHLNYITYAAYEGDEYITQQIINYQDYSTNIDNSVQVDIDGDVRGDLDIDTTNVTATGDGAVAAGDDVANAATGDGAQIIDGANYGSANTGDGAVVAGGDVDAPVNTGVNTGILADGDVDDAVLGDGNQVANIDGGLDSSALNFGSGDVTNFGSAEFDNAAVAVGGEASNVSDNYVEEGSALATGGGDATGHYESQETDVAIDYESHTADVQIDVHDSVVGSQISGGEQEGATDVTATDNITPIA